MVDELAKLERDSKDDAANANDKIVSMEAEIERQNKMLSKSKEEITMKEYDIEEIGDKLKGLLQSVDAVLPDTRNMCLLEDTDNTSYNNVDKYISCLTMPIDTILMVLAKDKDEKLRMLCSPFDVHQQASPERPAINYGKAVKAKDLLKTSDWTPLKMNNFQEGCKNEFRRVAVEFNDKNIIEDQSYEESKPK